MRDGKAAPTAFRCAPVKENHGRPFFGFLSRQPPSPVSLANAGALNLPAMFWPAYFIGWQFAQPSSANNSRPLAINVAWSSRKSSFFLAGVGVNDSPLSVRYTNGATL